VFFLPLTRAEATEWVSAVLTDSSDKAASEVERMIAGSGAICNQCIAVCAGLIAGPDDRHEKLL